MIKKLTIVLLILFSFILQIKAQNTEADIEKLYKEIYKDKATIAKQIEKSINTLVRENKLSIEGEHILSKKFLPEFYAERNYEPAWTEYSAFLDALQGIENSYNDGLLPTDYNLDGLVKIGDTILHQKNKKKLDEKWVAEFDILLTDAIFLYAFHLVDGKTDPHSLDVDWNFGFVDLPDQAPERLSMAIKEKTISKRLDELRPNFPEYRMLMKELSQYRKIQEEGGWGTIKEGGKIDPGNEDLRISQIRKRLLITGNLTDLNEMPSNLYDEQLKKDVISFQGLHGLDTDGIIGKGTFAALNISVEKKIEMLRVNMERARWIFRNIETDYIVVNIARFKVFVEHDFEMIYETNVMVGKTFHKTPVFKAKLEYLEFNPTWTVPVSITRNEMVPKIKKDPGYLKKNHFVLLDGSGNIVPESSVDFSSISATNFPYTIRQVPGPWNALGEVKFIFPNKHSVFLHDTQAKSMFSRASRTFSHGCIRVQNPHDLAEVLLKGTEWDRQKIDELVASKETKRIVPKTKYDVFLLYWTAGLIDSDKVFYLPDVYNRDQAVLKKLNEKVSSVRTEKF